MRFFNYVSDNLSISHNVSKRTLPFVPHTHQAWEILFIKSGDLNYIVEDKIYHLGIDTLIITKPTALHSISFNTREPYERYRIYFNDSIMPEDLMSQFLDDLDIIDFKGNELIYALFDKMRFYCDEFDPEAARILLKNTVVELIFNIIHSGKSLKQIKAVTKQSTIVKATEYINGHITDQFNIDDLASKLFITRSHLYHLFIKHLNITPKKYILHKKLLLAQRDLRMGYKPIEVCIRCGFSNYSTFYRDYKEHFGYPPSAEKKVPLYRSVNE